MSDVSFGFTICYVDDVEAVLARFEAAFNMQRRLLTEDGRYGELDTGATVLAFAEREFGRAHFVNPMVRKSFDGAPNCLEFVLLTDEVQKVYDSAIAAGMSSITPPLDRPWGQTLAWVRDPAGVLIELSTPS